MKAKILVVDDEPDILNLLQLLLSQQGFDVQTANSAKQANNAIAQQIPDLILLDWMMPQTSGLEFATCLCKDDSLKHIPVIMLTAKSEEADKLSAYGKGMVDDYVVKPFSNKLLIAKIKAVLRRSANLSDDGIIEYKNIQLDTDSLELKVNQESVNIGPTEFKLLKFLVAHVGKIYSREQLLDLVWGQNTFIEDRTVDVHVLRLRKVLKPYGIDSWIQTVRGVGYRFSAI